MARLLMQSADSEDRVISLRLGVNRVGRGQDNDIQIDHPTLSARHCELHWAGEQVRVKDCGSTNGVFVDGQPAGEAVLEPGQMLRLGSVELYVESVTAQISVPRLPERPAEPVPLPDGAMPCSKHPQDRAEYRCTHCGTMCCAACVHSLKLSGSRHALSLCPKCSGHLESIGVAPEPKRKKGLLALLAKTLRLPFRRKRTSRRSRNP